MGKRPGSGCERDTYRALGATSQLFLQEGVAVWLRSGQCHIRARLFMVFWSDPFRYFLGSSSLVSFPLLDGCRGPRGRIFSPRGWEGDWMGTTWSPSTTHAVLWYGQENIFYCIKPLIFCDCSSTWHAQCVHDKLVSKSLLKDPPWYVLHQ